MARYVREERPGLSWARNRAIIESRSDVIAFCDDDCVMEPETLRGVAAVLARNPDVDAVTGLVEPLRLGGSSDELFDRYFAVGPSLPQAVGARTSCDQRGEPRGQYGALWHRSQPRCPAKRVRPRRRVRCRTRRREPLRRR